RDRVPQGQHSRLLQRQEPPPRSHRAPRRADRQPLPP
ncbi:hypothetical protein BN1708_018612, partial [Verticillium longisporum]